MGTVLEHIVGDSDITHIVAMDIECTCWEKEDPAYPGPDQHELIEIGMALIDLKKLAIVDEVSILVKPVQHPVLTPFCVGLTSITDDMLVEAPTFREAMAITQRWLAPLGDQYHWCSWGLFDLKHLLAEAERKQCEMAFPAERHFNAKEIYSKTRSGVKKRGLGAAVARQKLTFSGTQHRGVDDARNVARILLSEHGVTFDTPQGAGA
jgi:inhibitor of KinA sporulation pathway (predicted exonuclease)